MQTICTTKRENSRTKASQVLKSLKDFDMVIFEKVNSVKKFECSNYSFIVTYSPEADFVLRNWEKVVKTPYPRNCCSTKRAMARAKERAWKE